MCLFPFKMLSRLIRPRCWSRNSREGGVTCGLPGDCAVILCALPGAYGPNLSPRTTLIPRQAACVAGAIRETQVAYDATGGVVGKWSFEIAAPVASTHQLGKTETVIFETVL